MGRAYKDTFTAPSKCLFEPDLKTGAGQNSSPSLAGQSCRSALNLGGAAAPPYRRCEEFCLAPFKTFKAAD
jgi:hypothetical protein